MRFMGDCTLDIKKLLWYTDFIESNQKGYGLYVQNYNKKRA